MGQTICEKILAKASGRKEAVPGEYIWAKVNGTGIVGGEIAGRLERLGIESFFDPELVYVVEDHCAPAPTTASANRSAEMRKMAAKYRVGNFFEWGRHGVLHELFPDHGFVSPGDLIACIDSHSTSYGCFNAAGCSIGEELPLVLATGQVWLKVPPSIRVEIHGELPGAERFVVGKDLALHIASRLGGDFALYQAIEFGGDALASISIAGRFTLANMAADTGAKFAIFPFDPVLEAYLRGRIRRPAAPVAPDPDAHYDSLYEFDASELPPYVAFPHRPDNAAPVSEAAAEKISLQQVFIGSCCGGRLEDFEMAARVLRGRRVHPGVRLIATPASQRIWQECLERGIWKILADAEALVTHSTCGACAGAHLGLLGDGEVCLSTSNRNYQGRMGSPAARIYLSNAATAAASAVAGRIVDPREVL